MNISNDFLSRDSAGNFVEYDDDTVSVACTSCSDNSNNASYLESNGVHLRANYVDNIGPPSAKIASVFVENSTNVTIGNKTYIQGPVTIKQFVVDGTVENYKSQNESDKLNPNNSKGAEQISKWKVEAMNVFRHRSRLFIVIFGLVSVAVITVTAALAGYYLYVSGDNVPDTNATTGDSDFEFVDRIQYGAHLPKLDGEPLALPVRQVIISHTATPNCTDYSVCVARVLQIQEYHMRNNNWTDIGLNFLVGGDGRAYEGCGYTVGAHTYNYNSFSICIAFIGDFKTYEAPSVQLRAAQRLIDHGLSKNQIHPDYVLYGQRQLRNFDSPGLLLFEQIKSWSHWSSDIHPI